DARRRSRHRARHPGGVGRVHAANAAAARIPPARGGGRVVARDSVDRSVRARSPAPFTVESLERWASSRGAPAGAPAIDGPAAEALGDQLSIVARTDKRRAFRLAAAFVEAVNATGAALPQAIAMRCRAHAHRNLHRFREAVLDYDVASRSFERL